MPSGRNKELYISEKRIQSTAVDTPHVVDAQGEVMSNDTIVPKSNKNEISNMNECNTNQLYNMYINESKNIKIPDEGIKIFSIKTEEKFKQIPIRFLEPSPLKFPKPRNRMINNYKEDDRSLWQKWLDMVYFAELIPMQEEQKLFPDDTPKWIRKQDKVTHCPYLTEEQIENRLKLDQIIKRKNINKNISNENSECCEDYEQDEIDENIYTTGLYNIRLHDFNEDDMIHNESKENCIESFGPEGITVNLSKISNNTLPFIFGTIEGAKNIDSSARIDIHVLLDSGASHNVINKKMLNNKRFNDNVNITPLKVNMTSATTVLDDAIIGKIDLRLTLLDENGITISIKETFYIAKELEGLNILLGQTFFRKYSDTKIGNKFLEIDVEAAPSMSIRDWIISRLPSY